VTFLLCGCFPLTVRSSDEDRAIVPVTINGVEKGELLAIVRAGDVLLRVADLEETGVHGFSGRREQVGADEFVSLSSLAPAVRFAFDRETISLRLTFPPELLGSTVVRLRPNRPPNILYSTDTSAFFNYSINWQDFKKFDGFTEAGLSWRGNLLYSSVSRTADGDFVRGLTNYTVDDRNRLRRWVAGDTFAGAGGLGGSLFLAGLSVSRNFDLDPYFVRYPTLAVTGAVTTPSTVEVLVNGAIVRREQVPPGQFDFTNLIPPAGNGITQVVIRDAFGQERTVTNPFYASTQVLAQGLSEYTYNVGFRREGVGVSSFDYGSLAFLGRHRYGATTWLTPEVRFEADKDLVSGGPGFALRLPVGEVEGYAAASRDNGLTGAAGALTYRYIGQPVNFGGFVQALSSNYANLSLRASQDRARLQASAFAGIQLMRGVSLTAQYSSSTMRNTPSTRQISLLSSIRLSPRANIVLSASRSRRAGVTVNEGFAGLSYFLPGRMTASVSYDRKGSFSTPTAEVQKSLPVGEGFGYRLSAAGAGETPSSQSGLLQYQGPYGLYQVGHDHVSGQDSTTVSVSGGMVAIGGTISPRRAVGDSFALIRVPEVEGVTGLVSNNVIGRTNGRGDLFLPDLLSYYGNRISIRDTDLPINYAIDQTEATVAPPFRGGALVLFPVRRIQTLTGSVQIEAKGERVIPGSGQVTIAGRGQNWTSPLGRNGEFYFENLPSGPHAATVEYREGACRFTLSVPESKEFFLNLGKIVCTVP
jgi:outer membrane usher protein